jgi:glycosyltransferase involved in cell wall biosynthesis
VITTDVGGLPEAVDHGKTGLVVPAQDPQRLAAAILGYYQDDLERGFREEIGLQTNRFAWDEEVALVGEFLASND